MSGEMIGDLLSVGGKVQEECDRLRAELEARVLERDEALRCQAESMAEERCLRVELADFKLQLKEAAAFSETMRQELAEVRVERDQLKAEMTEAQRLVKAANLDKDRHKDMYEESHAEVLKLRDKIKALTEEPVTESELGGMLVTLRKDNKSLAYQLQHAEQRESACIRTNLALEDRLRQERASREKRVAELQEERDKARHKLEDADDRIAALEQAKGELQAELERAAATPVQQPESTTNEQVPVIVNLEWEGPNDVLKLENEELKKQIEEHKAAARQALVQHEGTKGLLREVQIERDHQKELLEVYKSMQRLIDATFSDDV